MFNAALFADRRKRLLSMMEPDSVTIIPTAPTALYSNDTDYRYRPDSDFYYLTGFREPEAVAILSTKNGAKPFTLFVRPRDPDKETWTGRRAGVKGAVDIYAADEAFEIGEYKQKLAGYLENVKAVYHFPGKYMRQDRKLVRAWHEVRMKWRQGIEFPRMMLDLGYLMHEMRLIKTPADMEIQRQACNITCDAHELAMRAVRPGTNEREIEALIDHFFRASGGFGAGFPTIVASGINGIILHYIENECTIGADDLVLVDAGAEYEMFNGDVTRTYPASGKFSPEQRAIYDIVLKAQEECIDLCTIDHTPDDMHNHAVKVIVEGLIHLHLLDGPIDKAIEAPIVKAIEGPIVKTIKDETYKKFYMHRTGHWLGVDVHDVGSSCKDGKWRKYEPGMVTTVEPGIYIPIDNPTIPEKFCGIGVRIEDNIFITTTGPENLTSSCPKRPEDLEEIIGR